MSVRLLRAIAAGILLAFGLLWWLLPRGVAELVASRGRVEYDRREAEARFTDAPLGTVFALGDGLRTSAKASADVVLSAGPRLKVRASTLVRFRGTRRNVAQVSLAHGELDVFTIEEPVLLETAAGLVRLLPRSHAVLREHGGETWIDVVLGRAELEWASASVNALEPGESARYDHRKRETLITRAADAASGTLEARPSPAFDAVDASAPTVAQRAETESAPGAAQSDGRARGASVDSPLLPDLIAPAEANLTFLDPAPPTRLRFEGTPCGAAQAELELEQAGRFLPVAGLVNAFNAGTSRYRLRCGNKLLRTGRVRVLRDAGHEPLTQAPPQNQIEADGRTYTVLYQTRLPDIRVHWASARGQCNLIVESGDKRRAFPVVGGQAELLSGALAEGSHKLWFEQPGSDVRSRTTQLEIRFDNATPMARLSDEPAPLADGSVAVSGVVVSGARVSIAGAPVALDSAGRFRTQVRPDPGARGFAVRVELPRRSVVYYVRRLEAGATSP